MIYSCEKLIRLIIQFECLHRYNDVNVHRLFETEVDLGSGFLPFCFFFNPNRIFLKLASSIFTLMQ